MSDTLIGVIVGGIIASIVPIINLWLGHKRWKSEASLEYLKSERRNKEELYSEILRKLADSMANNKYPIPMISDIMIFTPRAISDRFYSWMDEKNKDASKAREALLEISVEMKRSLAEIDEQIKQLITK